MLPSAQTDRKVPILRTEATEGLGIAELAAAVDSHYDHISQQGTLEERRGRNLRNEVLGLAAVRLRRELERSMQTCEQVRELLDRVVKRELDPASAAELVLEWREAERP